MFRRKIETVINNYFKSKRETILVIDGARQIGKSYIISKLSKLHFKNYVEINLREDFDGEKYFGDDKVKTTNQFYLRLSSLYGNLLGNKDNTIIFLDEIQVYPHLLTMLKSLNKEGRFTYIVSGSLLGVTLKHTFIPMGSIKEEKMYPMDFEEFLWANNVGSDVIEYVKSCFDKLEPIDDSVHDIFLARFKEYLLSGGLPDAVKELVVNKNVMEMRKVQEATYNYYEDDCSKYDLDHKLKITRIYEMMPSYMENKVKRIQISKIDNKKETLEKYQDEFDYLISSGVAIGVKAVSDPRFPLIESSGKNLIKLYYNDVGILTNILYKYNIDAVLNQDKAINLGSVYETVVMSELLAHGHQSFYFDSKKTGETDCLINDYDNLTIIPIEIKSGKTQNEFRAIPKLVDPNGKYKLPKGYIFGNKNIIKREGNLITFPIYTVMFL